MLERAALKQFLIGVAVWLAAVAGAAPAFEHSRARLAAVVLAQDASPAETTPARHFTPFGRDHGDNHAMAEPATVHMMNPMSYIGAKGTVTASHWRIRHGTVDRDTSLAIPVILAAMLQNAGAKVDFAMPWGQGHGGDYDLPELFAWIDAICR